MALADTSIENDLRRKLNETRKALRNLVAAVGAYADTAFIDGTDSKEADKVGRRVDKRLAEAIKVLNRYGDPQ
jgi:hypothetical protein